ncbi:MAG: Glu/Leu/Phe/Val dehydrogenase dimerization domain-containing protein [Gemmatimonadota bacterium]
MQRPEISVTPSRNEVWERYASYLSSAPELVIEWTDAESPARGWLVINSLRGGAAGGGTRMRAGLTRDEVQFLAKVMELKFSISGPPIGGAKSGIDFDPDDPRKQQVLRRWFRAIRPFLETCYSTAGDLNVDEVRDVVPACRDIGLLHPQQGLACGHLGLTGEALVTRLDALRVGLGQPLTGPLGMGYEQSRVADVVTGFSVATAGLRLCERQGRSLEGVRVLMEGFGRVGGAAALYLARWGARIVGIVDDRHALISDDGLDEAGIEDLLRRRKGTRLPPAVASSQAGAAYPASHERFGEIPADMIVCAAASGTVDYAVLDRLEGQGVDSILCGANHPFAAAGPGDTAVEQAADERFAVAADFICNLGTAHAFALLLQNDEPADPVEILDSIEMTVWAALDDAIVRAGQADRGLLASAIEGALARVSQQAAEL